MKAWRGVPGRHFSLGQRRSRTLWRRASQRSWREVMSFVVKWIPRDQDVTIDHSTRYEHSSQAIEFACNALQLSPKKIWIEDDKGKLHIEHDEILGHAARRTTP
jgi:hypothetical protein